MLLYYGIRIQDAKFLPSPKPSPMVVPFASTSTLQLERACYGTWGYLFNSFLLCLNLYIMLQAAATEYAPNPWHHLSESDYILRNRCSCL